MFKIDNIGPTNVTNLQRCLCCDNECHGSTGGTGGQYSGTGTFGPGFPNAV